MTKKIPKWLKNPTLSEMAALFDAWGFYFELRIVSKEDDPPKHNTKEERESSNSED